MGNLVDYRLEGGVATLTLDDAKKNALSLELFAQLESSLERAQADRAVVLLRGRPGVFSAGFDLKVLMAGGPDSLKLVQTGFKLAERLLSHPAPVVLACTGHAVAMGAFLLLAGDYRVGAAGDFKIGANEVAIGITMPFFGIEICRQRLSPAHFQRAVINAEIFSPADAVAAGFLDRVVPESELMDAARAVAGQLAKLDKDVHTATKLRARQPALAAIRAAIEADHGGLVPGARA